MNRKNVGFTLAFVFFVGLCPVSCSKNQVRHGGETQATNSGPGPRQHLAQPEAQPWDDWLVLQEDQYVPIVDEVGRNFELARSSFLKMDFSTAAKETRKAAAFLKDEMATASREEKKRLNAATRDLNQLANRLDHQSVESLAWMDEVFGEAHQVDMERHWTVVGFQVWSRVARAPEAHFRLAEQALLKKDYASAAREIRKAAGLLKLETTRTTAEGKDNLNRSRQKLIKLAVEVQSGSVTSAQRLSAPFAAACYALAESHFLKATEDWKKSEPKNSGHELEASVLNLSEGAEWAGHGAEFDSSLVVKNAIALSRKLISGDAQTVSQIAPEVRSVGNEIENLKKEIKSQA